MFYYRFNMPVLFMYTAIFKKHLNKNVPCMNTKRLTILYFYLSFVFFQFRFPLSKIGKFIHISCHTNNSPQIQSTLSSSPCLPLFFLSLSATTAHTLHLSDVSHFPWFFFEIVNSPQLLCGAHDNFNMW